MKLSSRILCVLAVGVALLSVSVYAQVAGTIRGKVLDREGKPLQGAVVRIESLATRLSDDARTNRNGDYSISGLYQGQYKATVLVDGKAVMVKGNNPGDAIYIGAGDVSVSFDLRNAPATPPPTPAAPTSGNAELDKKTDEDMRKSFSAGLAALNAKNFEEAIRLLEMAAAKDPSQSATFGYLGVAYSNVKKYDQSVTAFRKSVELNPNDPAMHALLSLSLANMGKFDDAAKSVQEVAKLDPSMAGQSYYNLGAILTNRGASKEAVAAFNKAIEIDPKNAQSYYQLGIAYFATPDTIPQAVAAFEKFLKVQPTGPEAEAAKGLIEAGKAQTKGK